MQEQSILIYAVVDKHIVTTAHYKDMGPWMSAAMKIYLNTKCVNLIY